MIDYIKVIEKINIFFLVTSLKHKIPLYPPKNINIRHKSFSDKKVCLQNHYFYLKSSFILTFKYFYKYLSLVKVFFIPKVFYKIFLD